eukprot:5938253-Amphidinium_carterae.2
MRGALKGQFCNILYVDKQRFLLLQTTTVENPAQGHHESSHTSFARCQWTFSLHLYGKCNH